MIPIDIEEIECCSCHVLFWVTKKHKAKLQDNKKTFYCPNGHSQSYTGKTDAQKLKEEKQKSERYYNYYTNQIARTEAQKRKTNAYKGNFTKAKKKLEELKDGK